MVLNIEIVQGDKGEGGYRVVSLGCQVGDEDCDILFQLCQVVNDVTLIKVEALLIVLLVGDAEEEFGPREILDHALYLRLHSKESLLGLISLTEVAVNLTFHTVAFSFQLLLQILLFIFGHLSALHYPINLVLNVTV